MVLNWVVVTLLGVPGRKVSPCEGCQWGMLGHEPGQQDCHPLQQQEPRVHGTIKPHRVGEGH